MEKIEENAIILDYMPQGRNVPPYSKEPIAQVIGNTYFTLLEVVPKKDEAGKYVDLKLDMDNHTPVYIGKGERDKIHFIKRRIMFLDLTSISQAEVPIVIKEIVESDPKRFLDFFNKSQPITMRQHQLELLPKVGKKLMWEILAERNKAVFTSFDDIKNRVKNMPNPEEVILERIMQEIRGETKRYIFTATPPVQEQDGMGQGRPGGPGRSGGYGPRRYGQGGYSRGGYNRSSNRTNRSPSERSPSNRSPSGGSPPKKKPSSDSSSSDSSNSSNS